MRALTQSLVLYEYLIFGQHYNGKVLPFIFGAWLYHNFSNLSSPPVTMTGGGCFDPINSNPKHNSTKALLKNSRFRHSKIAKTLDFIGFFGCSSALCEMAFSQFSRKFLASFSQFFHNFRRVSNPFWIGSVTIWDYLIAYGGISKRS